MSKLFPGMLTNNLVKKLFWLILTNLFCQVLINNEPMLNATSPVGSVEDFTAVLGKVYRIWKIPLILFLPFATCWYSYCRHLSSFCIGERLNSSVHPCDLQCVNFLCACCLMGPSVFELGKIPWRSWNLQRVQTSLPTKVESLPRSGTPALTQFSALEV